MRKILYILPYIIILIIFSTGAALYLKAFSGEGHTYRFSIDVTRRSMDRLTKWYEKEFKNSQTEELFKQAGIKLSAFFYQSIRYSILGLWLVYMTYERFKAGVNVNMQIALWLLIFLASTTSTKLFSFKSPIYILCQLLATRNKEKCNIEIDRCLSQLKNMAISMKKKALSSDYIVRELAKPTKLIRPHLNRLLGYWYENRYSEGQEYFTGVIGTEAAKAFAGLLAKLDYLAPEKLISQIELYQSQVGEQRKTAVKKVREAQGNIVFLIALISGFIILINFFVIVAGIDTLSMLQKISF